jgi:hypothetical protein
VTLLIGAIVLVLVYAYYQNDSTVSASSATGIPSALPPGPDGATSASPGADGILHWFDIAGNDLGVVTNPDGSVFDDSGE